MQQVQSILFQEIQRIPEGAVAVEPQMRLLEIPQEIHTLVVMENSESSWFTYYIN